MNIYHQEDGIIFRKVEGEAGISYIAVDLNEIGDDTKGLLVRHGDPRTGNCGYYPISLLYSGKEARIKAASRNGKRPPSESWVKRTRRLLRTHGFQPIH